MNIRASVALCLLGSLGAAAPVLAQTIETYAGNGTSVPGTDGSAATSVGIPTLTDLALSPDGTLYYVDGGRIRIISTSGTVVTVPGVGPTSGPTGPSGPGSTPPIATAGAIAVGPTGNVLFSDGSRNRIFRLTSALAVVPYAGTGTAGSSGDGGPALAAQLSRPGGLAFDEAGNLYVADSANSRIRRITPDGTISTYLDFVIDIVPGMLPVENVAVAPDGTAYVYFRNAPFGLWKASPGSTPQRVSSPSLFQGLCAGGAAATQAVAGPARVGPDGLVYVANGTCISRLSPTGSSLAVVAGTTTAGYSPEPGPLATALFRRVNSLAFDASGRMYVGDAGNLRIRRITGLPPYANSPPIARAGEDQVVVEGDSVQLDARASTDPDDDALAYSWSIVSAPAGSTAVPAPPQGASATFIADVAGTYQIRLEVDDGSATATDDLEVTALTIVEFATQQFGLFDAALANTPDAAFGGAGLRIALLNLRAEVLADIQAQRLDSAIPKIDRILRRIDGCHFRGVPDRSGQDDVGRDWIVECGYQTDPYFYLRSIRDRID
jgi:sugar lactone lactonase YvrE